jgi:tungstate transport system substrate-binding protein
LKRFCCNAVDLEKKHSLNPLFLFDQGGRIPLVDKPPTVFIWALNGAKVVMRKIILTLLLLMINTHGVAVGAEHLRLATTTSTENSGLLAELLPPFEQTYNCQVDIIAVGTGKALKLAEAGDVDVILVHARRREEQFVAAGYGVDRRDVMYNDFVLIGPDNDPAGIRGLTDIDEALRRIVEAQQTFVSRGDDSGTHIKERSLWQSAGIVPAGDWYLEAGRGMGEVVTMATERHGYTLADRGTYVAYKDKTDLKIMVAGDERLYNPYGVIAVNPVLHPHVNHALTLAFIDYLTSAQGQRLIAGYTRNDEPLFFIDTL